MVAGPLARRAAAQTPKPGGIVKQAWLSSPRTLDPALAIQGDEYMIMQNIFDNLVRIDEKLQPQPQLATRWAADDQGKTWTFYAPPGGQVPPRQGPDRPGRRVLRRADPRPEDGVARAGRCWERSRRWRRSTRARSASAWPRRTPTCRMALGATFGRIVPSDRPDKIATEPSGTGPFRIAEFRPGDRTRMVKNPDYWDPGKPYLDELWQVNLPQAATQIASLSGGDVQMVFEVPAPFIGVAPAEPRGLRGRGRRAPRSSRSRWLSNQKPFDDSRVRLAMKHARGPRGHHQGGLAGPRGGGRGPSGADDQPVLRADHAQAHVRRGARPSSSSPRRGYPNGISVEIWTSNERVGLQELAVAVQQMAAPAGIKLEVKTVPWAVFNSTVYKKKSLYVNNWFGRGTIDETLYAYFRTGGGWNEGEFSKAEARQDARRGRASTVDMEKRKEIYAEAQQFIHDEGHMVVAYHMNYVTRDAEQREGLRASTRCATATSAGRTWKAEHRGLRPRPSAVIASERAPG